MGSDLKELNILNEIAGALNRSPDVESTLSRSLALVAELLDLQTGWVWLGNSDAGGVYLAATLNLPPYLQQPVQRTGEETCSCIGDFKAGKLAAQNVDVMECSRLRRAIRNQEAERTAKFHVTSLLNKLGAGNRAQLAALAVQRGLVS